jgi:hypothetical protein
LEGVKAVREKRVFKRTMKGFPATGNAVEAQGKLQYYGARRLRSLQRSTSSWQKPFIYDPKEMREIGFTYLGIGG